MRSFIFCLVLLSLLAVGLATSSVKYYSGLTNVNINRTINIQSHVEEVTIQLNVENTGDHASSFYLLPVAAEKAARLAFVKAFVEDDLVLPTSKVVVSGVEPPAGTVFYHIALPSALKPKDAVRFQVHLVFTRTLTPFPTAVVQSGQQLVLYKDFLHAFSAYPTKTQTTQVKLAPGHVESYTKKGGVHKDKENVIEYGPFVDIAAFSTAPLEVHYQNDSPFATMTNMKRLIEVSHWGNVNVEDHYELEHSGAKLQGGFSRLDYQRGAKGSSFRQIDAALPASATNIYYRDQIGNISTSHVRELSDPDTGLLMEVQPRFPMFGGWKADFYIGYDQPAHELLFVDAEDSGHYVLNVTFSTPFAQVPVDDLEVHVILPEFSNNVQWKAPFDVDEEDHATHVTYLDTAGRPVLILRKKNVVPAHNQYFQVSYHFCKCSMLNEPVLLVAAFFLFFVASMAYMRISLSLSDPSESGHVAVGRVVYKSSREGKLGQLVNRLCNVLIPQSLAGLESGKSDDVDQEIKETVEQLKKDPALGECAERLDSVYRQLKRSAARVAKADLGTGKKADEQTKLQSKTQEIEQLLEELSRL